MGAAAAGRTSCAGPCPLLCCPNPQCCVSFHLQKLDMDLDDYWASKPAKATEPVPEVAAAEPAVEGAELATAEAEADPEVEAEAEADD